MSVWGVEKPDRLLALEFCGLSLDLAFLTLSSDFLFAACHLFTISDPFCPFGKAVAFEAALIVSSKLGPVEYALVIGLLAEPVLILGPVGMAPVVLVVIWEPVGMALVVVVIRGPVGMAVVVLVMADPALVRCSWWW